MDEAASTTRAGRNEINASPTVDSPGGESASRNGYHRSAADLIAAPPRVPGAGWCSSGLAHLETGLIIAVPIAPVVATFLTVLMYIDPVEPGVWRDMVTRVPLVAMCPGILVIVWLMLGLPLALLRFGTASRANPGSHAQLNNRLLAFETYRGTSGARQELTELDSALDRQLDFVWTSLRAKGPKWVLGDAFISLWRQVDQIDSVLNYAIPKYRVWARAQGLLLRLPTPTASTTPDLRSQLTDATQLLTDETADNKSSESRGRGVIAQVQMLIDSRRTDRYSGLLRARNIMLAACSMTALAVYALFWLGIIALPPDASQPILGAALFFTTVGALVGLFQLLYAESQADTGVDDYGLSLARIIVAPQLAGLAALVGVVLTSLTTFTLSGSPLAPPVGANTIPGALEQIRNPANVLVAVAFALSPGLVFSRFRQNIEQAKRELSRTSPGGGGSSAAVH